MRHLVEVVCSIDFMYTIGALWQYEKKRRISRSEEEPCNHSLGSSIDQTKTCSSSLGEALCFSINSPTRSM